ncbi:MAG TPA: hypothetical protein VGF56_04060 [Rhizomicrobium sp.]|jgi:hypothetical protein
MTLRKAIGVVAELASKGVLDSYAIAGAVAALNYIQPTLTEDLDILISVDGFERHASGPLLLGPIDKALADLGYTTRTNLGYEIEGWPVQFLPVGSPLDEEALEQAIEVDLASEGEKPLKARSLTAEHVVAVALKVGRLKDLARVQSFLFQKALDFRRLKSILERHNLMEAWKDFCGKAGIGDPL